MTFSCQPSFSFIYLGYLVYYLPPEFQVGTLWRFLVSSRYHGTDKQITITVWSTLNTPDTASNSKEYMPTASSNVLNSLLASLVSVISFFHVLTTLSYLPTYLLHTYLPNFIPTYLPTSQLKRKKIIFSIQPILIFL